ncbi:MAG TPA: helix-turn-helix domain-containing protein [Candidatus Hydrogenedentes bacterium]|nr:helix-turn-helix domain-containing protein [Candidatus Hydrogenedentota bacterium]HPC16859.1 helix-turn-helix domain-containing protein [Candidatus Hydrogenedentota bacterium]HPC16866.1 helix-turn-helix domain-containing protein [Candidatus Hydrogenedentota bacterium]HRT22156.1 helix-turn-helix domain-containing protein [Candidatus Hydrogenedentota bacterium]HRT22163.1 helix-turn-helix domain-containing protein [Candidatus Hydrogenedentota bacterium]
MSQLLSVKETAKRLALSCRTVYRLSDAGRMPRPLRIGGAVRWDARVLEEWIAAGCPPVERHMLTR